MPPKGARSSEESQRVGGANDPVASSSNAAASNQHLLDDAFRHDIAIERQRFMANMESYIVNTYASNVQDEMESAVRSITQQLSAFETTVQQCKQWEATELHAISAVLEEVVSMASVNDNVRRQFQKILHSQREEFSAYEAARRDRFRRDLDAIYTEYGVGGYMDECDEKLSSTTH